MNFRETTMIAWEAKTDFQNDTSNLSYHVEVWFHVRRIRWHSDECSVLRKQIWIGLNFWLICNVHVSLFDEFYTGNYLYDFMWEWSELIIWTIEIWVSWRRSWFRIIILIFLVRAERSCMKSLDFSNLVSYSNLIHEVWLENWIKWSIT